MDNFEMKKIFTETCEWGNNYKVKFIMEFDSNNFQKKEFMTVINVNDDKFYELSLKSTSQRLMLSQLELIKQYDNLRIAFSDYYNELIRSFESFVAKIDFFETNTNILR